MNNHKISLEQVIFFSAFVLALAIRIFQLGNLSLTELEANLALQAHELAIGNAPVIGSHAGYISLTSMLFYFFGSSEFLARFFPAIFGSFIVFFPYLLRREIGRPSALILAFGFALDPGLVGISRQAGSMSLSVVTLLLALGCLKIRSLRCAGFFAGIFLISGPGTWSGVIILSIVIIWTHLAERKNADDMERKIFGGENEPGSKTVQSYRIFFYWMLGTALVFSTALFQIPMGISSILSGVAEYFLGWVSYPKVYLQQMFAGLTVYELLPLFFGILGIGSGLLQEHKFDKFLSRCFIIALFLALIYPERQITDLIWVIIPLWILAARQIVRISFIDHADILPHLGVSIISFVILVFTWINSSNLVSSPIGGELDFQLRLAIIIGSILLIFIVVFLVSWGWSWRIAANGFLSGLLVILTGFTLSACWHSAGLSRNPAEEIWRPGTSIRDADLLISSIQDLSEWSTGQPDAIDLIVIKDNSQALKWILRNYDKVDFAQALPVNSNVPLVITDSTGVITLPLAYTGQDFIWEEEPAWDLFTISNWINWAFYRRSPNEIETVILWARSDIFPGVEPITLMDETD
ncbi:MAG: hypothetical protein MUO76_00165 [Anaerolineaceae bacterium]|nr:hypothetical protein [Anaerolineaceae bacterium]